MNFKKFPENIKVLSWNYDFQLELAFSNFSPPEEIEFRGTSFLHSPSILTHYPNLDPIFSDFHFLSLIHLNGIAGYAKIEDRHSESIFQAKFRGDKQSALTFLEKNNLADHLHFAWEGGTYHKDLMQHVETMIDNTTILVVVGYSFPFFNREFDKQVFEKLKSNFDF